jgi:hypothetical protein
MIRRVVALLFIVTLTMAGCSDDDESDGAESNTASTTTRADSAQEVEGSGDPAEQAPFEERSRAEVTEALSASGLELCDEAGGPEQGVSGSYEEFSSTWVVDADCRVPVDATVHLNAYNSEDGRNETAFEQFGDEIVAYAFGQYVVSITEGSQPVAIELFVEAMTSLEGAAQGYDLRG